MGSPAARALLFRRIAHSTLNSSLKKQQHKISTFSERFHLIDSCLESSSSTLNPPVLFKEKDPLGHWTLTDNDNTTLKASDNWLLCGNTVVQWDPKISDDSTCALQDEYRGAFSWLDCVVPPPDLVLLGLAPSQASSMNAGDRVSSIGKSRIDYYKVLHAFKVPFDITTLVKERSCMKIMILFNF